MPICPQCGEFFEPYYARLRICKDCYNANRQRRYRTDPIYRAKHLEWGRLRYYRDREKILRQQRETWITVNGKHRKVSKRPYPADGSCELCGDKVKLVYHHWDDGDFMKGIWVCSFCHGLCEKADIFGTGLIEKYLQFKSSLACKSTHSKKS